MEASKFVEYVQSGMEYEFEYNGKEYSISNNKNGFHFANITDKKYQSFDDAQNLFEKAEIDDNFFTDIWSKINDLFE